MGIEIGEWNYGAEGDMSGGLATAETLGRFADAGVAKAFYWTFPPRGSPAYLAFRAFRDFDGHGGRFLDQLVPVNNAAFGNAASVWASRDVSGKHLVVVVLGFLPDVGLDTRLSMESCGSSPKALAYVVVGAAQDFAVRTLDGRGNGVVSATLPPYSMTTLDIRLE